MTIVVAVIVTRIIDKSYKNRIRNQNLRILRVTDNKISLIKIGVVKSKLQCEI